MKRDHATEGQIRARMAAQLDDEVKCALSDYIITNDGTVSVEEQITSLIAQLKERK